MKKIIKYGLLLVALAGVATACSKGEAKKGEGETKTVKLGIIGDDTDVLS
jgi:ABC-type glycerol-3-phosphate transport system substrate-binding protein